MGFRVIGTERGRDSLAFLAATKLSFKAAYQQRGRAPGTPSRVGRVQSSDCRSSSRRLICILAGETCKELPSDVKLFACTYLPCLPSRYLLREAVCSAWDLFKAELPIFLLCWRGYKYVLETGSARCLLQIAPFLVTCQIPHDVKILSLSRFLPLRVVLSPGPGKVFRAFSFTHILCPTSLSQVVATGSFFFFFVFYTWKTKLETVILCQQHLKTSSPNSWDYISVVACLHCTAFKRNCSFTLTSAVK